MNDEKKYGPKLYELNLRDAIDKKLLCEYKIMTPIFAEGQYDNYINHNNIVIINGENYTKHSIMSALLLLKTLSPKHLSIRCC